MSNGSEPNSWQTILLVLGAVIGLFIGGVVAAVALDIMGIHGIAGGIVGLICGLLPYFLLRNHNSLIAKITLAVCVVSGMVGGALLAVPASIGCAIMGYRKIVLPARNIDEVAIAPEHQDRLD